MYRSSSFAVSALLSLTFVTACASSGVEKVAPPTEQQMMEKWMAFMTPSEGHKALADKAGRWSVDMTWWMPGAPEPTKSSGTSDIRWIMDGRYLEDRFTGSFMEMPFLGQGLQAYDNLTGSYSSTWVDNMGTGLMVMRGEFDAATKTFTHTGAGPDVVRGTYVPMRMVETWTDKNHFTVEFYGPDFDGKEYKSGELRYTRQG